MAKTGAMEAYPLLAYLGWGGAAMVLGIASLTFSIERGGGINYEGINLAIFNNL